MKVDLRGLLVSLCDVAGDLQNLQTIAANGAKLFMRDRRVKQCFHMIGRPSGRLIICEGFATGATLLEATGEAIAVAFERYESQGRLLA